MKSLIALSLAFAPLPSGLLPVSTDLFQSTVGEPSPYFIDANSIVQIICPVADGSIAGTAFYVGNGNFITANHVVEHGTCLINGMTVTVLVRGYHKVDYAMVHAEVYPEYRAIISCDGFKDGAIYYSTGYAAGNPWLVTQRLVGSNWHYKVHDQFYNDTMTRGSITQGMSGGPVVDSDGRVVGINSAAATNGASESFIMALADTPLCPVK